VSVRQANCVSLGPAVSPPLGPDSDIWADMRAVLGTARSARTANCRRGERSARRTYYGPGLVCIADEGDQLAVVPSPGARWRAECSSSYDLSLSVSCSMRRRGMRVPCSCLIITAKFLSHPILLSFPHVCVSCSSFQKLPAPRAPSYRVMVVHQFSDRSPHRVL